MKAQPHILLLDLHPSSHLADTLQEILTSSFRMQLRLSLESMAQADTPLRDSVLLSLVARYSPDVLCLILSSHRYFLANVR